MPGLNALGPQLPDITRNYRLAVVRNALISATGDVLVNGQSQLFVPAARFTVNFISVSNPLISGVSGTIATGLLGIFTGAGATGTTVAANQALTPTQTTGTTAAQNLTLTGAGTTVFTAGPLYINVGTAVANATCDIMVFGQILQV